MGHTCYLRKNAGRTLGYRQYLGWGRKNTKLTTITTRKTLKTQYFFQGGKSEKKICSPGEGVEEEDVAYLGGALICLSAPDMREKKKVDNWAHLERVEGIDGCRDRSVRREGTVEGFGGQRWRGGGCKNTVMYHAERGGGDGGDCKRGPKFPRKGTWDE